MTTIKIKKNHIEVKGHTNYGTLGNDIVCASISTAVYFLIAMSHSEYIENEGEFLIDRDGINKEALTVFTGYAKQLAKQYPDNIRLENSDEKND